MNTIEELRDKVADIKYDTQQVLDRIDSMDAAYQEQTGREKALQNKVGELKNLGAIHAERIDEMKEAAFKAANTIKHLKEVKHELESKVQGQYDDIVMLQREVAELKAEVNALEQPEQPTMPVIPKAVAIAIFREGVAHGVSNACDEIDNTNDIHIEESGYTGGFEVSFSQYIDLSEHLDLDWMRDKVGDYDEASVIEALKNLCADKKFECRIHGVDDNPTEK
jgi:FtsZ-binding cell division protein ZapB